MFNRHACALLLAAIWCHQPADGAEREPAKLPLEDCQLENSLSRGAVAAKCGWYEVAENREATASKRIRIRVAVVPALRRQALPDPVVVISGGPGQAASDFYLASKSAFEELRRDRDLIVVDQRGTGSSQRLDCKYPDSLESARFDAELIKKYTLDCLKTLPGDPRFYTTSVAVRDLDEIRSALGYRQINVYGISYGTRVAQHYLRRYPMQVRTIVLDGVVPTDIALGPEVAPAAEAALRAILARCRAQTECRERFPDLESQLANLAGRLERRSTPIMIPNPRSALVESLDFGYSHFAAALRLHSYSDDTASLLPFLISEAAQERPHALAAQALLIARDLGEQLANGMHNAVVCSEDVPFISQEALKDPALDQSYLRRFFLDTLVTMCSVWPRGIVDDGFHAPISSDAPALLLSGENDPVTPAHFGERAARGFRNGKHLIVPGKGHGQLNNACVMRVMARFVADTKVAAPALECVAKQRAAPFMLNASGPAP